MRVGLVNNMPAGAVAATARQFRALLAAACPGGGTIVPLALTGLSRAPAPPRAAPPALPAERLGELGLDAVIVTGAEPRAHSLRDEPFFAAFGHLVDDLAARGIPSLFSCLAAHAAVLHRHGIERRRLPQKRFGVFDQVVVDPAHPLASSLPAIWRVPASRWNTVDTPALRRAGYAVLAESAGGPELFTAPGSPTMLFAQNHPEYEARTLLGEYARDLRHVTRQGQGTAPHLPANLLGEPARAALLAAAGGGPDRLAPVLRGVRPRNTWRAGAAALIQGWLRAADAPALRRAA